MRWVKRAGSWIGRAIDPPIIWLMTLIGRRLG